MIPKFYLSALRSNNERVYLVSSLNGWRPVENAQSLAHRFETKEAAEKTGLRLASQFAGLRLWAVDADPMPDQFSGKFSDMLSRFEVAAYDDDGRQVCPAQVVTGEEQAARLTFARNSYEIKRAGLGRVHWSYVNISSQPV